MSSTTGNIQQCPEIPATGLTLLFDNTATGRQGVDFVFIHGLNGHPKNTWMHSSGFYWPWELRTHLENSRVMTFGYNARVESDLANNFMRIQNVSSALVNALSLVRVDADVATVTASRYMASQANDLDQLYSSIRGFVFFGVPHGGSSVLGMKRVKVLQKMAKAAFTEIPPKMEAALESDSDELVDLADSFRLLSLYVEYKLIMISFFETKGTVGLGTRVVDEAAAAIHYSKASPPEPIDADHTSMIRFKGVDDSTFRNVLQNLKRVETKLRETVSLSSAQAEILRCLPRQTPEECLESIEEPFPNTFNWVVKHPKLKLWIDTPNPNVLLVSGPSGSGKSVLAAFMYRYGLQEVCGHFPVLYCFDIPSGRCTAAAAWSSLSYQLLKQDPSLFSSITSQTSSSGSKSRSLNSRHWKDSQLQKIFESVTVGFWQPSVYIIDALDKCDETLGKFLDSLSALIKMSRSKNIKILIFSRSRQAEVLSSNFSNIITMELDEEPSHQEAIQSFIEIKVNELSEGRLRPFREVIMDGVSRTTAMGMYLLPMLAIERLKKPIRASLADIRRVLDNLPQNLFAVYRQALDNVPSEYRSDVSRILLWVVFGDQPLTVEQLASAAALKSDTKTGSELEENTSTSLLSDPGIVQIHGPLLKATTGDEDVSEGDRKVCLIHRSAHEFLLKCDQVSDDSNLSAPPNWLLNDFYKEAGASPACSPANSEHLSSVAHRNLAENCLHYLQICLDQSMGTIVSCGLQDIQEASPISNLSSVRHTGVISETESVTATVRAHIAGADQTLSKEPLTMFPTLRYCYESLPEHIREVSSTEETFHRGFARYLVSEAGREWIKIFWILKDPYQAYGRQPPLHFATSLALYPTIRSLLALGHEPSSIDANSVTALQVATSTGSVDVLRLLFEHSVRPDAPRTRLAKKGNLLHIAAWYGYKDATEYLLKVGMNPFVYDESGRTAFEIAAESGNKAVVEVFLNGPKFDTHIESALSHNRLQTVQWLVEQYGLDPASKNWCGNIGLHAAAANNTVSVIEYFLDRCNVDINIVDDKGRSALHHACLKGCINSVFVLARRGIERWALDEAGHSAFEYLLGPGYMRLVGRTDVLSVFKDICDGGQKPSQGGNALHLALRANLGIIRNDDKEILEILLGWKLDPCIKDDAGNTALLLAAGRKNWVLERFLMGCDCINVSNSLGRTPLHTLLDSANDASSDLTPQLDILLKRGADLAIQDSHDMTALHFAAMHHSHRIEIDRLLMDQTEESIDIQDNHGRTSLHLFLGSLHHPNRCGTSNTLRRLEWFLMSVADVDITDNLNKTPVHSYIDHLAQSKLVSWDSHWDLDGIVSRLAANGADLQAISKNARERALSRLRELELQEDSWIFQLSLDSSIPTDDMFEGLEAYSKRDLLAALASTRRADDMVMNVTKKMEPKELQSIMNQLPRSGGAWRLASLMARGLSSAEPFRIMLMSQRVLNIDSLWETLQDIGSKSVIGAEILHLSTIVCASRGMLPPLEQCFDKFSANIDAVDSSGRSLLCLASWKGHKAIVASLLRRNSCLESEDMYKRTALYWAAQSGSLNIVKLLLEHGAKLTTYAVGVGELYGHEEVSLFLRNYGTINQK